MTKSFSAGIEWRQASLTEFSLANRSWKRNAPVKRCFDETVLKHNYLIKNNWQTKTFHCSSSFRAAERLCSSSLLCVKEKFVTNRSSLAEDHISFLTNDLCKRKVGWVRVKREDRIAFWSRWIVARATFAAHVFIKWPAHWHRKTIEESVVLGDETFPLRQFSMSDGDFSFLRCLIDVLRLDWRWRRTTFPRRVDETCLCNGCSSSSCARAMLLSLDAPLQQANVSLTVAEWKHRPCPQSPRRSCHWWRRNLSGVCVRRSSDVEESVPWWSNSVRKRCLHRSPFPSTDWSRPFRQQSLQTDLVEITRKSMIISSPLMATIHHHLIVESDDFQRWFCWFGRKMSIILWETSINLHFIQLFLRRWISPFYRRSMIKTITFKHPSIWQETFFENYFTRT